MSDKQPIIEVQHVSKAFGGVRALQDVQFEVVPGEVHALLGENGAGKSTLVKILTGIYGPTAGSIFVDGHEMHFHNPLDARRHGLVAQHDPRLAHHLKLYWEYLTDADLDWQAATLQNVIDFVTWLRWGSRLEVTSSIGEKRRPSALLILPSLIRR